MGKAPDLNCVSSAQAEVTAVDFLHTENDVPTKELNAVDSVDVKPVTIVELVNVRSSKIRLKPYMALIDTGSARSHVKATISHYGKVIKDQPSTFRTANGQFTSKLCSRMKFALPEFSKARQIEHVFHILPENSNLPYDMIIGRDLLRELKMDVLYSDNEVVWDDLRLPMNQVKVDNRWIDFEALFEDNTESDTVKDGMKRLVRILDANYDTPDIPEEVSKMKHLNDEQKNLLLEVLTKHENLFDGKLGEFIGPPVEIELKDDAKPYHARAFPIPHIYEQTFKKDLDRLVAAGVLRKINHSEWAAPTFIIPKKDGRVRFVTDFRKLNKQIKRKPYPLPHIKDMLLKVSNFTYATALDLVMGFYNITLSPDASKLCTITTPFGKYEYLRLPMGVSVAPDVFQDRIYQLFEDLGSV